MSVVWGERFFYWISTTLILRIEYILGAYKDGEGKIPAKRKISVSFQILEYCR